MKHMTRILSAMLALSLILCLAACSTHSSMSYTFGVDNGDNIKIELDTSDGYSITADVPFVISDKNGTVSEGTFAYAETYATYRDAVDGDTSATILDEGSRDDCTYFMYSVSSQTGSEYNYIILINESDTCILLGSLSGEEAARAVFDRLTFTKI